MARVAGFTNPQDVLTHKKGLIKNAEFQKSTYLMPTKEILKKSQNPKKL